MARNTLPRSAAVEIQYDAARKHLQIARKYLLHALRDLDQIGAIEAHRLICVAVTQLDDAIEEVS